MLISFHLVERELAKMKEQIKQGKGRKREGKGKGREEKKDEEIFYT